MFRKVLAAIILVTLALSSYSYAHSWYPWECCSGTDCAPVPCEQILETAKGYMYQGLEFTKEQVKPSLDNLCHACISSAKKPLCLFIQTNS